MSDRKVITLSAPYPLLDEGEYVALCTEASFAWARQWKKWIARLALEPQNYRGRPYQGTLCKFLSLGKNPERPCAGHHSAFASCLSRRMVVSPSGPEVTMRIFEGRCTKSPSRRSRSDRQGKGEAEHWYSIIREIHRSRHSNRSTLQHFTS